MKLRHDRMFHHDQYITDNGHSGTNILCFTITIGLSSSQYPNGCEIVQKVFKFFNTSVLVKGL